MQFNMLTILSAALLTGLATAAPTPLAELEKRAGSWTFQTFSDATCSTRALFAEYAVAGSQNPTSLPSGGYASYYKFTNSVNAALTLCADTDCKTSIGSATSTTGCVGTSQQIKGFSVFA